MPAPSRRSARGDPATLRPISTGRVSTSSPTFVVSETPLNWNDNPYHQPSRDQNALIEERMLYIEDWRRTLTNPIPVNQAQRDAWFRPYYRNSITRSFHDHDEYLAGVFNENPDPIYRGCTWVHCNESLPRVPFGMSFECVYTGTRSDSQVSRFLTDSGYDQDGRHRTHYGPEFDHSKKVITQMASKYRNTRTLLQIFTSIKKNYNKLILNPNAYSWKWLTQKINHIMIAEQGNRRVLGPDEKGKADQILDALNKFTGKEFVYINNSYLNYKVWPKSLCKYYLSGEDVKRWITQQEFDLLVEKQRIRLCNVTKEWFWYSIMFEYRQRVNSLKEKKGIYQLRFFANIKKNFEKIQHCQHCNNFYEKSELKENPLIEMLCCPACFNKPVINQKVRKETDALCGYHSHRDWRFLINRKDEKDTGIVMGIELEIHSKLGNNMSSAERSAWTILQAQFEINKKWNEAYFEKDGSLEEGGFEMITNPMALEYSREYWTAMLPHIRKTCTGWNIDKYLGGDGNYGIHITFDRKYFGDYRLARFIKFVDAKENQWFMRGIAQRTAIYGRGVADDLCSGNFKKLADRIMIKDKKILSGIQRYQPINVKGDGKLVELRFFRTTLNTESFLKNIEFTHAMNEWCKTTAFSINYKDFCNWLLTNTWCHKHYPNLIGYLSREKLPVKGIGSVKNLLYKMFNDKKAKDTLIYNLTNASKEAILSEDLEPCV
jgi:hypothetical protein